MRKRLILVLLLGASTWGCQSVPRPDAVALSQAGLAASGSMKQSLTSLGGSVTSLDDANIILTTMVACDDALRLSPPGPCVVGPIVSQADGGGVQVAQLILARAAVFEALGEAYSELGKEAEYDAKGDLEGSLTKLNGTINTYAALLGGAVNPILSVAEQALLRGGGLLAGKAQDKRLKTASRIIDAALTQSIDLVEKERTIYLSLIEANHLDRENLAMDLIARGAVDRTSLMSDYVRSLGLTPSSDLGRLVTTNPPLKAATDQAFALKSYRERQAAAAAFDNQVKALKALRKLHADFAAGKRLALSDVQETLSELAFWTKLLSSLTSSQQSEAKS